MPYPGRRQLRKNNDELFAMIENLLDKKKSPKNRALNVIGEAIGEQPNWTAYPSAKGYSFSPFSTFIGTSRLSFEYQ